MDQDISAIVPERMAAYVGECLTRLAEGKGGSLDQAVAGLLSGIVGKGRASWRPDDEAVIEEKRSEGVEDGISIHDTSPLPLLVFDRDVDRDLYLLRESLPKGRGVVDGSGDRPAASASRLWWRRI